MSSRFVRRLALVVFAQLCMVTLVTAEDQVLSEPLDANTEVRLAASDKQAPKKVKQVEFGTLESAPAWGPIQILDSEVAPGSRSELHWTSGQSFDGRPIETPVVVTRGARAGPTLCLTAAVHGDELNGVEIVRRTLRDVDPEALSGTLIGVPIVNLPGFSRGSRYLPDRRDLNRFFPGNPYGSSASRIAHGLLQSVIRHCDWLVDFHTASFKRTNLPQLRANLRVPEVRAFVERFGATSVLHKEGAKGTLRGAATQAGVPTVVFELGEPGTLQLDSVEFGVKAINTLLHKLEMVVRFNLWSDPQPVFYQSRWLRALTGGILTSKARVGRLVKKGEVLGVVTNPVTNETAEILSPYNGRLLGRALNQFVMPGFATFHVGIGASQVSEDLPWSDEIVRRGSTTAAGDDGVASDVPGADAQVLPTNDEPFEDETY